MRVERFSNKETFSRGAADFILQECRAAIERSGRFAMALSGGKSPKPVYEQLALPPVRNTMPWEQVHLFWGDERCVPPQHPDSNFGMVHEVMICHVPIPAGNVHPVPVKMDSPEHAAAQYDRTMRAFFAGQKRAEDFPSFDLILLGVGADGHTASLFPGSPLLEEKSRWAAAAFPPRGILPAVPRITLTLPVINAARCVLFLASISGKREVLRRVIVWPDEAGEPLPAALVRPQGKLVWFLEDQGY